MKIQITEIQFIVIINMQFFPCAGRINPIKLIEIFEHIGFLLLEIRAGISLDEKRHTGSIVKSVIFHRFIYKLAVILQL